MDNLLIKGLDKVKESIEACDRLARCVAEIVERAPGEFGHLRALAESLGIGRKYGWLDNSLFLSELYISALQMRAASVQMKSLTWCCVSTLVLIRQAEAAIESVPWRIFPFSPEGRPSVLQEERVRAFLFITAIRQPVAQDMLEVQCATFVPLTDFTEFSERLEALRLISSQTNPEGMKTYRVRST